MKLLFGDFLDIAFNINRKCSRTFGLFVYVRVDMSPTSRLAHKTFVLLLYNDSPFLFFSAFGDDLKF